MLKPVKDISISLRLSQDLFKRLQNFALSNQLTLSQAVRLILIRYFFGEPDENF